MFFLVHFAKPFERYILQDTEISQNEFLQTFLTFIEHLQVVLINMIAILMIAAKLVSQISLKQRNFENKISSSFTCIRSITKILLRESNYISDVIMYPKFNIFSISLTEDITISIL